MLRRLKEQVKERLYARVGIPYKQMVPTVLLKYLVKGQPINLVDVGAYDGDFTFAIDNYCGVLQAVLIEPLPQKAIRLCERFNDSRFQVIECVLSSQVGTVRFEVNESDATSSILSIRRSMPELSGVRLGTPTIIQCRARTLDEIAVTINLNRVDLLKLDVQGAEDLVLHGSREVLKRTAMIWTEVSFKPLYDDSSTFPDIYAFLTDMEFKLFELEPGFRGPDGELLQGDALFCRTPS